MNRSSHPTLAALLAASSLAFALPATADPHGMGRHHAGPGHEMGGGMHGERRGGMRFLRGLDLTETQRDEVFKLFHAQAPAMRERMKAAHEARDELRKLASAAQFDQTRGRELADAAAKAHADLAFMRAESMSKVMALLTPEQRARLEEAREQRREGRRGHPHHR